MATFHPELSRGVPDCSRTSPKHIGTTPHPFLYWACPLAKPCSLCSPTPCFFLSPFPPEEEELPHRPQPELDQVPYGCRATVGVPVLDE